MDLYQQNFSQYFILTYSETKELSKQKPVKKVLRRKKVRDESHIMLSMQQLTVRLRNREMLLEDYRREVKRRFRKREL